MFLPFFKIIDNAHEGAENGVFTLRSTIELDKSDKINGSLFKLTEDMFNESCLYAPINGFKQAKTGRR